jgi:hypothetical protein
MRKTRSSSLLFSAICASNCLASRAWCDVPGGCECNDQWNGTLCDQCATGFSHNECLTRLCDSSYTFFWLTNNHAASCSSGCLGDCNLPGECYCPFGYHGEFCNISVPLNSSFSGIGVCQFADVTTLCLPG